MEQVKRKVRYRIYPSTKQANKMVEIMRLHQRLYNAALEQRIDAYRRCGKSLNYYDQAKDLTQLRAEFPEYAGLNAQSEQVTLKRLELAFQAFLDV
jgi:putative transposase